MENLRLGEEGRVITKCNDLSKRRGLKILPASAATLEDLRRLLTEYEPHILHISCHGSRKGLYFESENGEEHLVEPAVLAEMIALSETPVDAVVLNACYSVTHVDDFKLFKVPCLIAVTTAVEDVEAIQFATGFYTALAAGKSVELAFLHGRNSLKANRFDDQLVVLHKNEDARRRVRASRKLRAGVLVTTLLALALLTGAYFWWAQPKVHIAFKELDDSNEKIQFNVANKYKDTVVLSNFKMKFDDEILKLLEFGPVKKVNDTIVTGGTAVVDVEFERIVWKKVEEFKRRELLLDERGDARIEVTAAAAPIASSRAATMHVSSDMTLIDIRNLVLKVGMRCDLTPEGCKTE